MAAAPARRAAIRRRLLAWWDAGHRDLPWRTPAGEVPDPYRIWISEVMLQQTRVDAVIPYYQRFLARFPTLEALAAASEDDVLARWSGLGYYARARNLRRAAREALDRHGGLPGDLLALRALPGFGPYTAGAVASLAFGIRAAAVDGNVSRVLARVFAIDLPPASRAARERIAALAGALVPAQRAADFNQALMDLGATVCARSSPRCERCPLAPSCEAEGSGRAAELPPPRARAAPRAAEIGCLFVRRGDALLLARREGDGLLGGLWEPPSAPLEPEAGGAAAAGLQRALRARGLRVCVGEEVACVERRLTHRRLRLRAFEGEIAAAPEGTRWVEPGELAGLGVSTAMRRLVEAFTSARKVV